MIGKTNTGGGSGKFEVSNGKLVLCKALYDEIPAYTFIEYKSDISTLYGQSSVSASSNGGKSLAMALTEDSFICTGTNYISLMRLNSTATGFTEVTKLNCVTGFPDDIQRLSDDSFIFTNSETDYIGKVSGNTITIISNQITGSYHHQAYLVTDTGIMGVRKTNSSTTYIIFVPIIYQNNTISYGTAIQFNENIYSSPGRDNISYTVDYENEIVWCCIHQSGSSISYYNLLILPLELDRIICKKGISTYRDCSISLLNNICVLFGSISGTGVGICSYSYDASQIKINQILPFTLVNFGIDTLYGMYNVMSFSDTQCIISAPIDSQGSVGSIGMHYKYAILTFVSNTEFSVDKTYFDSISDGMSRLSGKMSRVNNIILLGGAEYNYYYAFGRFFNTNSGVVPVTTSNSLNGITQTKCTPDTPGKVWVLNS